MPVEIGQVGFDFFKLNIQVYCGSMLLIVYFMLIIFFLIIKREKETNILFVYPFLIQLLTIFNPYIMYPILCRLDWSARYYRFYWNIPIAILVAYFITRVITEQKRKFRKILVIGISVVALVAMRGDFITKATVISQNIYKIDNEVIQLSKIIHEHTAEEEVRVLYPIPLIMTLRQYDPSIISVVGRGDVMNQELTEELVADSIASGYELRIMASYVYEMDNEVFLDALERNHVQFFIVNKNWLSEEYRQSLGLEFIGETLTYYVYAV